MDYTTVSGSIKRIVAFRLKPGTGVMEGIEDICKKENIKNGVILSLIGSLDGARFFDLDKSDKAKMGWAYGDPIILEGGIELVTATGMACHDEQGQILLHIHATFSDKSGKAYGGHMIPGNKTLITVDGVLAEVEGIDMLRSLDPNTGSVVFDPRRV